ncbi:MAG TPA: hypothetical protein VJR30_11555 [Bradyrhizobium sp.]|nr:hypothetical protein [Bradyrhizobium sp.]
MEQDQAIRTGTAASVIAHLSLLALLVLLSDVSPLGSAPEQIAVNIVTPEEAEPEKPKAETNAEIKAEQPVEPSQITAPDPPVLPQQSAPESKPSAPAAKQASVLPQQPVPSQAVPERRAAAALTPPPASPPPPAYRPTEPDISVKYNVVLGLPAELPPLAAKPGKSEDGFDTTTAAADISSSVIAEFRRHLKTCSKLPASIQPSDHIMVKLRVYMTQDGRLAADPVIGGGSANAKAIDLLQGAIAGLKQCQPYKMLPADRYGEWKVLDLDFTPKDFSG